ncbi:unnamed protein product [Schistosoma margrebowiei]|uniref:Uncharacterized protein n=1 Tax=Schistosoma margrebowiei TaxID=48269 RepID=A0AA85A0N1_9TREM|nr:unnamed protein product [Schistosoma margrebowiei]
MATLVLQEGHVNFIYIYNSAKIMFRITNQQYSSIFSLHNQMDQALLVFTGLCRLMFCQNRTV